MIQRFLPNQPLMPPDVELLLESERASLILDLPPSVQDEATSLWTNLDSTREPASTTEHPEEEHPETEDGLDKTARQFGLAIIDSSHLLDTIRGTVVLFANPEAHLALMHAEDEQSRLRRQASTHLGALLRHGIKVQDWKKHHPDKDLTQNNIVAATVSTTLAEEGLGRKGVKRLARMMTFHNI